MRSQTRQSVLVRLALAPTSEWLAPIAWNTEIENIFFCCRLQARMATKKAKPNGQFHLTPEMVEEYFSEILISDLPGVGYSTTLKLKNSNLKTCSDLRQLPLARLQQEFGKKLGDTLHQYCRGIDIKPLVYDQVSNFHSLSARFHFNAELFLTFHLHHRYANRFRPR